MWYQTLKEKLKSWVKKPGEVKIPSPVGPYKRSKEQEDAAKLKKVKVSRSERRRLSQSAYHGRKKGQRLYAEKLGRRMFVRLKWWREIGKGQILKLRSDGCVLVAFPFRGGFLKPDGSWAGTKTGGVRWYHRSELTHG